MKQKKLGNILYVFDVNPYEITQDTDTTTIKVQEESYKGFVDMNPSLAEKIVKYNYHVICVNTPEWAPYVDQEDPQEQITFGIYGDSAVDAINQIQVQNENNEVLYHWDAPDIQFPFQCNVEEGQHCAVECKEGVNLSALTVTGIEYLPVRWTDQETGHYWYATYPINESISIGITSAEITVTAPNGLSIYDDEHSTWVDVYQDSENPELEHGNLVVGRTYSVEQRSGIGENKNVYFVPLCGTGQQGIVGAQFIAPETDLTITLAEIEPSVTHTVTFNGCEFLNNIMEQTPDHQTVVATYDNLSSQETITVNDGNIIACTFGSGISMSAYDITPEGFFLGEWQNPDTLDYVAWSNQIFDDVNVTIATPQPSTYTFVLEGSYIHQNVTVKVNGETTSYTPEQLVDGVQLNDGDVIDVYPTEDVANYTLISGATWDTDHWTATVNGADVDIWINYAAPVSTYTVTLDGSDIHQNVTVKMNGETVQTNIEYQDIADGTVVDVYPTGNVADYDLISGAVWDTDHWTATVNGADLTITINYSEGVNFVASWDNGSTPENVSQINIGSTPVTGNALTDGSWTDTVRLYPGSSNITFFVSTGLPSDMDTFRLTLDGIEHNPLWNIDPQTGDKTVSDDNSGAANPGTWTYNDNPDTGLPYIAFELPALSDDDTPWQDNDTMLIYVQVQGS